MMMRRTRMRWGGAFALMCLGAVGFAWLNAPEPPRAVFRPAYPYSFGQGFAEGGRSFLTHGASGTVVWDTATWRPKLTWPILTCTIAATSRDGRLGIGALGHDDTSVPIVVVDLASGEIRHRFEAGRPGMRLASFGADDQSVTVCLTDRQGFSREVVTWDLATGAMSRVPIGGPGPGMTGPQPVAMTLDGTTCALMDAQYSLHFWDARAGQPIAGTLSSGPTRSSQFRTAAFTPDGRTLVAGRADGRVEVWDRATERSLRTIVAHPGGVMNSIIVVGHDGRTALSMGWDPATTSPLVRVVDGLKETLGMNSRGGSEVVAVDLAAGQVLARWRGASTPFVAPDGRTAVVQQSDGSYHVHDIPPLPQ